MAFASEILVGCPNTRSSGVTVPTDKVLQLYTGWPWTYDCMPLGSHAHDGRSRLDEGT